MTPELHRPIATDRIGAEAQAIEVVASEAERAALARRLAIPAVLALDCVFALRRLAAGRFAATGRLRARVVQTCVVSVEEFEAAVDESFEVRFVPAGEESDDPDPETPDDIPYQGGSIDLGEAASEQLALALDPYPRRPDAALPEQEAAPAPHPFGVLGALKRDRH